jgi:hypothetical protein
VQAGWKQTNRKESENLAHQEQAASIVYAAKTQEAAAAHNATMGMGMDRNAVGSR